MSKISYDLQHLHGIAFDVDGVLSPSMVPLGTDGMPMRMVNIKDGYALQLAVKHGLHIAIITGADSPAIVERFKGLGITDIFTKVSVKLPVFKQWMDSHNLLRDDVAYVGDDIPDYECMRYAGLSIAPADAAVELLEIARYVSPAEGGHGVARDVVEQVMRARNMWCNGETAFGW